MSKFDSLTFSAVFRGEGVRLRNLPALLSALSALLAVVILTFSVAAPVARADEIPPPKTMMVDANGVDLLSGDVSVSQLLNSIGPSGAGGLSVSKTLRANGKDIDSLPAYISINNDEQYEDPIGGPPGEWTRQRTTLVLNGRSLSFEGAAGTQVTYTADEGGGTFNTDATEASGIIYTLPNGTRAVFGYVVHMPTRPAPAISYLKSIIYPTGEVLSYAGSQTINNGVTMESSLGYGLIRSSDTASPLVLNLTQGGCSFAACSGPTFAAQDTLGRVVTKTPATPPTGGSSFTATFTLPSGDGVRTYTLAKVAFGMRVTSVSIGGSTWTYSYTRVQDHPEDPYFIDGVLTTTVTAPNGVQRIVASRVGNGHVLSDREGAIAGAGGRLTTYTYSSGGVPNAYGAGKLSRVSLPGGDAYEYVIDGYDRVLSRTHYPKNFGTGTTLSPTTVTASYSCRTATLSGATICTQPDWARDELNHQTDFEYYPDNGLLKSVTKPAGPNGVRPQTRYAYQQTNARYYNSDGVVVSGAPVWRLASTSTCRTLANCANTADETVTEYAYQPSSTLNNALLTAVTTRAGDNSLSATTTYAYNARGDVIETDGPLAGNVDLVQTRYDASRWVVGTVGPDPDGSGTLQYRANKTIYRADGQVQAVYTGVVADRSEATFSSNFQIKNALTTEYDVYARPIAQVSANGSGVTYALSQTNYDVLGRSDCVAVRMLFSARPNACVPGTPGVDGPDRIAKTTYDPVYGQVTAVQSGIGVDPIYESRMTYMANGSLETQKDGETNLTAYTYDDLYRLQRVKYPNTTKGANSANESDYEEYGYNAVGNVISRRLRDGATIITTYDNLNRLWTKTTPTADVPGATYTYGYDNFDQLISTADGSLVMTQQYDALGRVTWADGGVGKVRYEYDVAGRRTKLSWPDTTFFVTYEYDDGGALKAMRRAGGLSDADKIAGFTYDDLGRRVTISRGASAASTSYAYDSTNLQLSRLTQTPTSSGDAVIYDLTYNAAGQVKQQTISNGAYVWDSASSASRPYGTDGLNRVKDAGVNPSAGYTTYDYDPRGNLLCVGAAAPACTNPAVKYKYDAENRLRGTVSGASLVYDPLGRLYQSTTVGGTVTRYLYDGVNLIGEYDGSNVLLRRYVFGAGADEVLVRYAGAGTTPEWFLSDRQGSIIATTNSAGAVTGKNTYDEYGIPGANNSGLFQYTGQLYLSELGLYHYKARAYSPTLGRFLQTDPIGYDDGLNWYAYVGNDPINGSDPTGMADEVSEVTITALARNEGPPDLSWSERGYENRVRICGWSCTPAQAANRLARDQFDEEYGGYFLCAATCAIGAPELIEGGLALSALLKSCNCFEAGTLVAVEGGYKPIEKVKVGDLILSRDDETGETAFKPVVALIPGKKRSIWDVTVEVKGADGGSHRDTIHTTEEHPFRTSDNVWEEASKLKVGSLLLTADMAPALVVEVRNSRRIERTFNLEIMGFHTYFVGHSGVWVHNACLLPTDKLAEAAAKANGWVKTNFRSSGRAVFKDPKTGMFFTADRTNHLANAMWKGAKTVGDLASKATRSGTFDALLKRIGG